MVTHIEGESLTREVALSLAGRADVRLYNYLVTIDQKIAEARQNAYREANAKVTQIEKERDALRRDFTALAVKFETADRVARRLRQELDVRDAAVAVACYGVVLVALLYLCVWGLVRIWT